MHSWKKCRTNDVENGNMNVSVTTNFDKFFISPLNWWKLMFKLNNVRYMEKQENRTNMVWKDKLEAFQSIARNKCALAHTWVYSLNFEFFYLLGQYFKLIKLHELFGVNQKSLANSKIICAQFQSLDWLLQFRKLPAFMHACWLTRRKQKWSMAN